MAVTEQTEQTFGAQGPDAAQEAASPQREVIYRHSILVRVTHWINVLCIALLLMSGLKLFNYHPALYWGNYGYKGAPTVLSIVTGVDPVTARPAGITRIGDYSFDTTGVLGVTFDARNRPVQQAFPPWAVLSAASTLALARDWHFLVAWVFAI